MVGYSSMVVSKAPDRPCAKEVLQSKGFMFPPNYKLGKGRYSKVIRAFDVCAQRMVAIKVIDLSSVSEEFRDKFLPREFACWKRLKNLNNCFLFSEFACYNYQFAVMELAEKGDLLSFIQKNGAIRESQGREWMIQLINAVAYLHSHKIAHRDLKAENVLLFKENVVKITDYGFCKQSIDLSETFCGSKSYSPPEILEGTNYDIFKADIWSLGVVGYVMLTNTMPFREDVQQNSMIVAAQKARRYRYPGNLMLSNSCKSTIDAMMTFDAIFRPSIKDCRFLPWFKRQQQYQPASRQQLPREMPNIR